MTDPAGAQAGGFGLYVHWPFCAAKCPYCDFNSHVAASIAHDRWRAAYLSELRRAAAETPGRVLQTVFFGGGTPSLMAPGTVAAILDTVRRLWPMVNDPEITLEANPTSAEAGRFRAFRDAGVNRVSIGIQSLVDDDLRRLGRLHSAAEARQALSIGRETFDRVSFDLIYARQGQGIAAWRAELTEALAMAADHLSLYQLTVEPGTAFADRAARGGLTDLPDDDRAADLYDVTQDLCAAHGLPGYEISNHAAPGGESRHNLIYWRCGDYVGIGPGAHGRLTLPEGRFATHTPLNPDAWLHQVESTGNGEAGRDRLDRADQAAEYLMMSLRLDEGTDIDRLARLGCEPQPGRIAHLRDLGLIDLTGRRLRATARGRRVLNAILRDLLAE